LGKEENNFRFVAMLCKYDAENEMKKKQLEKERLRLEMEERERREKEEERERKANELKNMVKNDVSPTGQDQMVESKEEKIENKFTQNELLEIESHIESDTNIKALEIHEMNEAKEQFDVAKMLIQSDIDKMKKEKEEELKQIDQQMKIEQMQAQETIEELEKKAQILEALLEKKEKDIQNYNETKDMKEEEIEQKTQEITEHSNQLKQEIQENTITIKETQTILVTTQTQTTKLNQELQLAEEKADKKVKKMLKIEDDKRDAIDKIGVEQYKQTLDEAQNITLILGSFLTESKQNFSETVDTYDEVISTNIKKEKEIDTLTMLENKIKRKMEKEKKAQKNNKEEVVKNVNKTRQLNQETVKTKKEAALVSKQRSKQEERIDTTLDKLEEVIQDKAKLQRVIDDSYVEMLEQEDELKHKEADMTTKVEDFEVHSNVLVENKKKRARMEVDRAGSELDKSRSKFFDESRNFDKVEFEAFDVEKNIKVVESEDLVLQQKLKDAEVEEIKLLENIEVTKIELEQKGRELNLLNQSLGISDVSERERARIERKEKEKREKEGKDRGRDTTSLVKSREKKEDKEKLDLQVQRKLERRKEKRTDLAKSGGVGGSVQRNLKLMHWKLVHVGMNFNMHKLNLDEEE